MNQPNILIIDDEEAIRTMINNTLTMASYRVTEAESGQEAFNIIYATKPDLILLDWMLPTMTGLEILRKLRREEITKAIPVIMLTAKAEEENLVLGLKSGADDYITKPFSTRALLARIEALLRRSGHCHGEVVQQGDLKIDHDEHRAFLKNEAIDLGPTEFKLLEFFMRNPNRALSRTQLLDNVWSGDTYIDERTVDVHIRRLRKALEDQAPNNTDTTNYIETIRGTGYRFSSEHHNETRND